MASLTTSRAAETLPRFLLPQLSWAKALPSSSRSALISSSRPQQPFPLTTTTNPSPHHRRHFHNAHLRPRQQSPSPILASARRHAFHATTRRQRDHHFDTLKFVQRLQEEGFTEEQSVAMMKVLNDVIEERYADSLTPFFLKITPIDQWFLTCDQTKHPKPHAHNGPPRGCRQSHLHPKG